MCHESFEHHPSPLPVHRVLGDPPHVEKRLYRFRALQVMVVVAVDIIISSPLRICVVAQIGQ